uniref:4'-phosphopantetheinyl transferase family protein n=1 Tax=Promineifilum sp. TaxID=2664178 RepID=UPI0035B03BCF
IEDYFTAAERELVAQAFSLHHVYANAIWSGKEAALKAIRRGLAEDTRIVTCLPQRTDAPETDWQPLTIQWERPERALPPLAGWWRSTGVSVMTLAVGREVD